MKTRFWFMAVVALQVLAVAGMIGYKQLILERGRTIALETAPRDPRDPMRGDFVRLNYAISNLDLGGQAGDFKERDKIFVVLEPDGRFWKAVSFSTEAPDLADGQALIRGKVLSINGGRAQVEYGIESYFIPEGAGMEVEREIREAKGMEVVVDDKGDAVLKGPAKR